MTSRHRRPLALIALLLLAPLLACDSRGDGLTAIMAPRTGPALSSLVLTSGTLTPSFNGTTTEYSAVVTNATTSVSVVPSVSRADLSVFVNGQPVASGAASAPIALSVGTNTIVIDVRNPAGESRGYTVSVRRTG